MSTRFSSSYFSALPLLELPQNHSTWCDKATLVSELQHFSTTTWIAVDAERQQPKKNLALADGLGYTQRTTILQFSDLKSGVALDLVSLGGLPDLARNLLEDPHIVKVINDPSGDAMYIFEDFGVNMKNVINIALMTKVIFPNDFMNRFPGGVGLSYLTGLVLGKSVDKTLQAHNFFPPYSANVVKYTLLDAFAVALVYHRLVYLLDQLLPLPRQEITSSSYTMDFLNGKPMYVGTEEPWVPRSIIYQHVVGPRVSIACETQKLYSTAKNIVTTIDQISVCMAELGLPMDVNYSNAYDALNVILGRN